MFALRQADTGVTVAEVCRKMGISEATYYNWKKKYGGLGVPELRRLKQLEEENQHLKQLVADLSLDKQMLQDVLKKVLKPVQRGRAAQHLLDAYRISARRACRLIGLQRASWSYNEVVELSRRELSANFPIPWKKPLPPNDRAMMRPFVPKPCAWPAKAA